jgi:uncharacterized protein
MRRTSGCAAKILMPAAAYFLPFILLLLLALAGVFLPVSLRRPILWTLLPAACCAALDLALLSLLPVLQLSFGSPDLPFLFFNAVRLLITLPFLAAILMIRKRSTRILPAVSTGIQILLSLLAGYALYIEPFHLTVTTLPVDSPPFLAGRPLRILHLTDLHMEHPTRRERDILAMLETLQPDLIVLTGDYLNPSYLDDPQTLAETRQFLSQLHAPYGVYAVNGTVDDERHMALLFDGLDEIQVLDDSFTLLEWPGGRLALLGVTNTHAWAADTRSLRTLLPAVPPDAYTVLLYHTPDLIETASSLGVDLYLAGHTHGGQVRLPFYGALITFSRYQKMYEMGEYRVADTLLYVSRGLGMEGWDAPRLRFLCPPEMVLVELGP